MYKRRNEEKADTNEKGNDDAPGSVGAKPIWETLDECCLRRLRSKRTPRRSGFDSSELGILLQAG